MVPCCFGFSDECFAFGIKSGKYKGAFNLGTGNGKGIVDTVEFCSFNCEGSSHFFVFGFYFCSHKSKGCGYTSHGSFLYGAVTRYMACERLSGEKAAHKSQSCSAVAYIQCFCGGGKASEALSMDNDVCSVNFNIYS